MAMVRVMWVAMLFACGGDASAPPVTPISNTSTTKPIEPPRDEPPCTSVDMDCALAMMDFFATRMCKCADKACADKVQADMTTWGTDAARRASKTARPSPEAVERSGEIMTTYTDCMTRIMLATSPPPPPPPPPPSPPPATPSGSSPAPLPSPTTCKPDDRMCFIDQLEEFQIAICACRDGACVDRVRDAMTKWGVAAAQRVNAKPDPNAVTRSTDIMTKYTTCLMRLKNQP
jgi:hypothetical protein